MIKIVAISDTHNKHNKITIPKCDLLISAGDWTSQGHEWEIRRFAKWLQWLLDQGICKEIVVVPGNHEYYFEQQMPASLQWFKEECLKAHLLIDEVLVLFDGTKIYGSPVQPWFHDWAWNKKGNEIQPYWDAIPDDTNILITHGPPYGILDTTTYPDGRPKPGNLGCERLMKRVKELKDLDLHFFGHIHYPGGNQVHLDGVSYYNAAVCDELYMPTNDITMVEYIK